MILYFADRRMNILGQASTELPQGLTITDDLKTEDVETGVAVFECKVHFDDQTRLDVENSAEVGNYILRSHNNENEFYTIMETEVDTKNQEIYLYAEDAGMDLLNEVVGAYEADKAYPISHYINKYTYDSGFELGINEIPDLERKLSWEGETTAAERLASVATQFDGEISFGFEIKHLIVTKKYINVFKRRGQNVGAQLRLNFEINSITTKKSIDNLATCLKVTGGTPENQETPITLSGYAYDDGDIYTSGEFLKSRSALERWSRYAWPGEPYKIDDEGHIVKLYSYDTVSKSELCTRAVNELKKVSQIETNYEVEIKNLPENIRVGDRVNVIDDGGELYVSTRILKLETSVADQTQKATLGEYLIKGSGISQKVYDLAARFAQNAKSAAQALAVANNAKSTAEQAKDQADAAANDVKAATDAAETATKAANTATESAQAAQTAANNAQAAVDAVEEDVAGLETSVANAQAAAEMANQAAATAQTKAEQAQTAANNAQTAAATAAAAASDAQTTADTAVANAAAAQGTADTAKTAAETAATTAAAAKKDAAAAQTEIDSLGENLTTLEDTMTAEYARKTDLSTAQAALQTQITKNAAEISSTASSVTRIDETANYAYEELQGALALAERAQTEADKAQSAAEEAQAAADTEAAAQATAKAEAETAKTAANTAKAGLDNARTSLAAAKADLATVQSRADATEEEITAAQAAVTSAQSAVEAAKSDWETALTEADTAQKTASEAAANADIAQAIADKAAAAAQTAQALANEASGDAQAAKTAADEAADTATTAQQTANQAATDAATAQKTADTAAATAATAQATASQAQATATQAAADLSAAQARLQEVLVDAQATEEEIATAQAAVTAAQSAADAAHSDAATAQQAADAAQAEAETAQTAADSAKDAADTAQTEADAAQAAANKAKAAVYGLSARMEDAETKITQNAHAIALAATKEEITQTLGGYYTKTQADAAITVKADEIAQSVSETYATKQEVDDTSTEIHETITEQNTAITQTCEEIILQALTSYTQTGDFDAFRKTTEAQLDFLSDQLTLKFTQTSERLESVNGTLQEQLNTITKYFTFDVNGLTIGQVDNPYKVIIDNDRYSMTVNGTEVMWIANGKVYAPEMEVTKGFKLFGYLLDQDAAGNVNCEYIGGE
ncbi:MAG: phage tail spike protein [Christensenellales bacterium]